MSLLRDFVHRFQDNHRFRILYSSVYPALTKLGIIRCLKKLEKPGAGDPWIHNKDLKQFEALQKRYPIDIKNLIHQEKKYTFGFLVYPDDDDLGNIKGACEALGVKMQLYDIRLPSLYRELRASRCDGIFIMPALKDNNIRTYFHEAAQVITTESRIKIYPSFQELNIYEAKRTLASFLEMHDIPHPATTVFTDYESACEFIENAKFPLVFKTHLGSSSNGVELLFTKRQAQKLAGRLFHKYYLRKTEIERRSREWGYMLLQEYVPEAKEFRIIKIGDSWFGYQKWKAEYQKFFSGSGFERWVTPPKGLLDFCFELAERFRFTTMCFDVFENTQGHYLVNELQTWFGSHNPSQMYIEDTPGRYRRLNGEWVFEAGLYNIFGSILLRLVHFISLLQDGGKDAG